MKFLHVLWLAIVFVLTWPEKFLEWRNAHSPNSRVRDVLDGIVFISGGSAQMLIPLSFLLSLLPPGGLEGSIVMNTRLWLFLYVGLAAVAGGIFATVHYRDAWHVLKKQLGIIEDE